MSEEETDALIKLYAKNFIQRREPVALQTHDGGYRPLRDAETKLPTVVFNRQVLKDHISGDKTYGHYLLDAGNITKLFVLDVDLTKAGFVPRATLNITDPTDQDYENWVRSFVCVPDLRAVWHSRARHDQPARAYIKYQLRLIGGMLASSVYSLLGIPTAVAYTGNKGIHIYGFTGPVQGSHAKDAAELVLESTVVFRPIRGDNFYADINREVIPVVRGRPDGDYIASWGTGTQLASFDPGFFHNFHVEVFPKQRDLGGKDLGNLVRLPLGRNLHAPTDPTFFLDLTAPLTEFRAVNPVYALSAKNPWRTPEENGNLTS